jgi:transmembrane sensor
MSDSPHHSCDDPDREAHAAGWTMRRDRGLTPGEQDEYLRWLAADPRHGECLARHQQAWRRLDRLVEWRPEHSLQPNPDLLAPPRRRPLILPFSLAAAAMVAWALVAAWPRIRNAGKGTGDAHAIAQDNAKPVVQNGATIAQAYERHVLEDGSVIEVNRGGAYRVEFTPGERRVRLDQGEAQFTVTKNSHRPFVVVAGGIGVRAVGTAFDVRLSGRDVAVLVTEGRVQVVAEPTGRAPALPFSAVPIAAGQREVFSSAPSAPPPRISAVSPEQMEGYLAWRPSRLSFTDAPLSEIVAKFNGRNRVQLVVTDPEIGALRFTLSSFRSDDVDGFVDLLQASFDVRAERSGDIITLSRAR